MFRNACHFHTAIFALAASIAGVRGAEASSESGNGQPAAGSPALAASAARTTAPSRARERPGARAPEFHRKAFNVTRTIYAKDPTVKACVKMSVYGTLEYRTALASSRPPAGRQFDRAVVEPTLTIKTFRGPKCQTVQSSVQLSSATLQQRWYDDQCSFDPGIYVGFPFAVGVSATGHCGQVHVAQRSTSSSANQSTYRQSNSGVRIRFGDTMSSYGRPPPCIAFDATAKITVRGASDIVTETFKVCPR